MLYPIGIQSFEEIRRDGYVYVDKTEYVHRLVTSGKCYFLSRPRRFGKSMLISTLEAYFKGRRDLFEGLAIEKLEKDWTEYEVLHLDMSIGKTVKNVEDLVGTLNNVLAGYEKIYGTDPTETNVELRLQGIIQRAYGKKGKGVVVLIDEYDKPMLDTIDNPKEHENVRDFLKGFYGDLKSQDQYIRFTFLTGVTKFSHVSVFSGLNNLEDISLTPQYSTICGITEKEMQTYFDESIRTLAESGEERLTFEQTLEKLRLQYDGYHFYQNTEGVYNPFSLLRTFKSGVFANYWFATGTPSFLVKLLKESNYRLGQLDGVEETAEMLGDIGMMHRDPVPVLYQSGYLTIRGYNERFRKYRLGFPNREVEEGFVDYLAPHYFSSRSGRDLQYFVENFVGDVEAGDAEGFLKRLRTMFDDINFKVVGDMEIHYENTLNVVLWMMGLYTEVERASSAGIADITIKTPDYIYILELKLDGSADEALRQIDEKGYAKPYAMDRRKLFKIGVNFSSATRTLADWKIAG